MQDPVIVAQSFADEFSVSTAKQAVFAIPGGKNLEAFKRIIKTN